GMDGQARIVHGPYAVDAVTVHADRGLLVPRRVPLPVHRGAVLGELVHARVGVEALHEVRVGVAAGAELRDLEPWRLSRPALLLVVGGLDVVRGPGGVAAVAVVAGQALLEVDV